MKLIRSYPRKKTLVKYSRLTDNVSIMTFVKNFAHLVSVDYQQKIHDMEALLPVQPC